jgi:hypothetical protein
MLEVTLVTLVILGLTAGLFHLHGSESACSVCVLCHAGVQAAVTDLASSLASPFLKTVGYVTAVPADFVHWIRHFSTLVPRAPPISTHPAMLREGCAGPA